MNSDLLFSTLIGVFAASFAARIALLIASGIHRSKDDLEGLSRIRALVESRSILGYFLAGLTVLQYTLGFVLFIWLAKRILAG